MSISMVYHRKEKRIDNMPVDEDEDPCELK